MWDVSSKTTNEITSECTNINFSFADQFETKIKRSRNPED